MLFKDRVEFEHMFTDNYNVLCNYAYNILSDRDMAEDVVQDVFVYLWEKRAGLTADQPLSYVFTAVKHKSLETLQKKKRQAQREEVFDHNQNGENTSEEEIQYWLRKEALYKSIKQLPDQCQKVFVLGKIEGKSYNQIAEALDITPKTVENHMGRAFKMLRSMVHDILKQHKD